MANSVEISSVGARVRVAFETTAGTRPTYGYCDIPDVSEAPEQDLSVETIDASNISDYITRYIDGRQDPGGDQAFTMNHTDRFIEFWESLANDVSTKLNSGLRLWFEYRFPEAARSYFWCGKPKALGTSGVAQNELDTIPAHVVLTDWDGWKAKSGIACDTMYVNISGTNSVVVNVYDYLIAGTITATSDTQGKATATKGTAYTKNGMTYTPITITGVAAGTAKVTVSDGTNSVIVYVTVS